MTTRRQFIKTSTAGAGVLMTGMGPTFALSKKPDRFEIKIYVTQWGFKGSYDEFAKAAKTEGFDGIESWAVGDPQKESELLEAIDKYNLSYSAATGSGNGTQFEEHLETYERNLAIAIRQKPLHINCHTGKDFFSMNQNQQLFQLAIQKSKESDIPIYQETHRGRALFAAHTSEAYLEAFKDLRLTLDISHWCNVSESLLQGQESSVQKFLKRVDHIHARVGHAQGPQVPDFRAPEWKKATDAHFKWWDDVVAIKKKANELLTVTPEFGPSDYMWKMPYTKMPLANQWEMNVHMMNEWRKRYI